MPNFLKSETFTVQITYFDDQINFSDSISKGLSNFTTVAHVESTIFANLILGQPKLSGSEMELFIEWFLFKHIILHL